MDHEASQVTTRHFELVMFRQQQGTTATSLDKGEDCPIQADFAGNPKTVPTARVPSGGCNRPASAKDNVD